MRLIAFSFILFVFSIQASLAQDTIDKDQVKEVRESFVALKRIFVYADSVNKVQTAGYLDGDIIKITDSLEAGHPAGYYEKVGVLMAKQQYNAAAFLLNVARLRYQYYNSTNPNYKDSGDGALSAALYATLSEPLSYYLKTNIENYIAILKKAVDWCKMHDYKFQPQSIDPAKYLKINEALRMAITDLEKNKTKYKADWAKERTEFEQQIDVAISEADKLLKKGK